MSATRTGIGTFIVGGILALGSAGTAAGELVAHRAIYHLTYKSTVSDSEIIDAEGLTYYAFSKGCRGWAIDNKTSLLMMNQDGEKDSTYWQFATWEALDGSSYRYDSRHHVGDRLSEEIRGNADLGAEGGVAMLSRPETTRMPLAKGTLFPTRHLVRILDAARDGQKKLVADLFDGASLDNPYVVNAVMWPVPKPITITAPGGEAFPSARAWDMRFAYFPAASKEPLPEFEMEVTYREDGIATRMLQIYDTFTLVGDLKRIETLPPPEC